jgi:hypothetical protein
MEPLWTRLRAKIKDDMKIMKEKPEANKKIDHEQRKAEIKPSKKI